MTHDESREWLQAWVDGEVPADMRSEISRHLETCSDCRRDAEERKALAESLQRGLSSFGHPADWEDGLVRRLPQSRSVSRRRWRFAWAAAAAGAILAVGAWLLFGPSGAKPYLAPGPGPGPLVKKPIVERPIIERFGPVVLESARGGAKEMAVAPGERKALSVPAGLFHVRVEKGPGPVRIETPAGRVLVKGTEFLLEVHTPEGGREEMRTNRSVSVVIWAGLVALTNPLGEVTGGARDLLYAEEGSAPKKQVADLASRFGKYYEPVEAKIEAKVKPTPLPIDLKSVRNPEALSKLGLPEEARKLLSANGFAVVPCPALGDEFVSAYAKLKAVDVPLFITSDALLHLYHIQFDESLKGIEEREFSPDMVALTKALLEHLKDAYDKAPEGFVKQGAYKAAAHIAVGLRLLDPQAEIPGFAQGVVEKEIALIEPHKGFTGSPLFTYAEDYSQYVPRGHYTRSENLKKYFKAMMWFGRMTFLCKGGIPYGPDAPFLVPPEEARVQTAAAYALIRALDSVKVGDRMARQVWERIYTVTAYYVGLADDLTPDEYIAAWKATLEGKAEVEALQPIAAIGKDETFHRLKWELWKLRPPAIYSGTGEQIATGFKASVGLPDPEELDKALDKTMGFRFMGQRFVPDSYAMGRLVFPTVGVPTNGRDDMFTCVLTEAGPRRGFPRGLDVMALLGSERAREILKETGDDAYLGYDDALAKLRKELDEVSEKGWNRNLYWSWLYSLQGLLQPAGAGYPTFMRGKPWLDKEMNTALGSWASLRHDTILYAKQSYTMGVSSLPPPPPPPPPGFCEPAPEFLRRLVGMARMTARGLGDLRVLDEAAKVRMQNVEGIFQRLLDASRRQLKGERMGKEDRGFFGSIGKSLKACIGEVDEKGLKSSLIADVHTDQNTKKALEEGTGNLELLVVAYPDADGIVLAAGPVFSYHEFKHPSADRLTDEKWREMLGSVTPPKEVTRSFRAEAPSRAALPKAPPGDEE